MSDSRLPELFSDLEQFVDDWAIPDETDRYRKRHQSTLEDVTEFYNAVNSRLDEIGAFLDQFSVDQLPKECDTLLSLALMCMECFPAVELFHDVHVPQTYPWQQFQVNSPRRSTSSQRKLT